MKTARDQFKMKKVLIVEDNPDLVYLLTLTLESLGYTVVTATQGSEGVEKAAKEKPHLILMDILMPGMDGLEATRLIHANPETKDIPILAITCLFRESELRGCIEAGCNDYLVKPFTCQELQEKIQDFIPSPLSI